MPEFKDFKSLESFVTTAVSSSLQNNTFEKIRSIEQEHIQSDVYDDYDPNVYERRYENNGLISDENIQPNMINDLTLEVINETEPNPVARDGATTDKDLIDLIEYGYGHNENYYDYPSKDGNYMDSRPFIENTIEDLKQNKQYLKAFSEGLKEQGISTT